jgi:hypothetical protein
MKNLAISNSGILRVWGSFQAAIQSRISFSRARIDRWVPRRSFLSVSNANHRST